MHLRHNSLSKNTLTTLIKVNNVYMSIKKKKNTSFQSAVAILKTTKSQVQNCSDVLCPSYFNVYFFVEVFRKTIIICTEQINR